MGVAQPVAEFTIPSDPAEARRVQERIKQALSALAYSEYDIFVIKLAVDEALGNAMEHGNQMDPGKRVFVVYTVTPERFYIRITDEGEGFEPPSEPSPTDPHILARPSGRGLHLMRVFMTEVRYHGRGNVVSMAKVREA